MKYVCALCGYVYKSSVGDPENGVEKGTDFEDISEDWVCPLCGASKEDFDVLEDGDDIDNDDEF
ncbi:MAG: rubredoxin [Clostridia bacterium]|nr:rubredoxin [Clostridia bacterium]